MLGVGVGLSRGLGVGVGSQTIRLRNPGFNLILQWADKIWKKQISMKYLKQLEEKKLLDHNFFLCSGNIAVAI